MPAPVTSSAELRNDPVALIRDKALWIRRRSFQMVYEAQLGHPGGDFSAADVLACRDSPAARALIQDLCTWARTLMLEGAPLALSLPGRVGWELRFVVQGGLAILDKIAARHHDSLLHRPSVGALDFPRLAWRALTMRAHHDA